MTTLLEARKEIYETIHHIPNDGWCRITDEDQAKVLYKAIDESESNYRTVNPNREWDDVGHNKFHRKELEKNGFYIVRWYKRIDKSGYYIIDEGDQLIQERADEVIFSNHFQLKYEYRGKNMQKFGL